MNQSLIEIICQKLMPFHSPIRKNKFTPFRDAVEQTEVSSCGKTKSAKVNRYILTALTLFSVQSRKVIYYEKALTSPLSPIPLNKANADGSWRETNMSKLKDIIIENTNLRTDKNLYELSRGITIVDIMSVLNSLVGILSSSTYEEFIRIFVECFPNEFGRVELIVQILIDTFL